VFALCLVALLFVVAWSAFPAAAERRRRASARAARKTFEAELRRRGVKFRRQDEDGVYVVEVRGTPTTINLVNVARDGDPEVIRRFVDRVLSPMEIPPWPEARRLLYWSAESADHEFSGDVICEPVSDGVDRVLVVTDREGRNILYVPPELLAEWSVSEEEVGSAATENLGRLLEGKRALPLDGLEPKLGIAPITSPFKASIIFSPRFKEFVSDIGWPVLVVIPCRDFLYVIAEADRALLDRMGRVVQDLYRTSGYPITTKVLRVSDEGIEAIGAFSE
jgi:hypothetical protein